MGCSVFSCSVRELQSQKEVWKTNSQRATPSLSGQFWKVGHGRYTSAVEHYTVFSVIESCHGFVIWNNTIWNNEHFLKQWYSCFYTENIIKIAGELRGWGLFEFVGLSECLEWHCFHCWNKHVKKSMTVALCVHAAGRTVSPRWLKAGFHSWEKH